ncbi:MAG TPA: molybdopterin cofactor-binding domain-containing protein [Candidatus Acidoferrales bacterium]|nr:molybdopterin cofactor-binding domain-containing protein [Candidatus Acidoferrales bacterium]
MPLHIRPPGGGENSAYKFDNLLVRAHVVPALLRGQNMRSPGRIQSHFACEQFIDEIAAATGEDPIAFRIRHLGDERAIGVLSEAARVAGWQPQPSPSGDAKSTDGLPAGAAFHSSRASATRGSRPSRKSKSVVRRGTSRSNG